ncbi:MAG: hypothetical protein JRI23_29140, partial [Deltaproteobacteria bacterium]|nr:hypothetical protein [Deltaproteobacteria bacterium]MBW2536197.1 hypothetical protein [Deltaproteobacteria bacterium]
MRASLLARLCLAATGALAWAGCEGIAGLGDFVDESGTTVAGTSSATASGTGGSGGSGGSTATGGSGATGGTGGGTTTGAGGAAGGAGGGG